MKVINYVLVTIMLIRFTFWILLVPVLLSWATGPSGVWLPPFMSFARPPGCHELSHLSLDAEKYQSYKEENATINQDTVAQDLKVTARKWRVLNDRKDVQLKPVSVTSSLNVSTKSSTWVSGITYNPVDFSATLLSRLPEHLLLPTSKQPMCSFKPQPDKSFWIPACATF